MITFPTDLSKAHFHCLSAALIIAFTIIAYANTFHVPFVLDDYPNIKDNHHLQTSELSLAGLSRAALESPSKHRWLPNLTFALNYYWHGLDVWGYHLLNLLIHMICGMLVYFLGLVTLDTPALKNNFARPPTIALFAALLWTIHPIQTNAVTYIVQRMTSMATLFFILAVLCYGLGRQEKYSLNRKICWFASCFLAGFLSLLCKENAAMLPIILVGYELFFINQPTKEHSKLKTISTIAASLLLLAVITFAFTNASPLDTILAGYQDRSFTLTERLLTQARVFWVYVSLLLLPLPSRLNFNYDFPVSTSILSPPSTLLAIFAIGLVVAASIKLYRNHRLISFAIFWFLTNLLIESTIIPLELVFEHRLYLPTVFFFIAVTSYLSRLLDNRPNVLKASTCALILALTVLTWQRNIAWQSEVSLWQDVINKSPKLSRAYGYLAKAYVDEGHTEEGNKIFADAQKKGLANTNLYVDWGKIAFENGRTDQAILYLKWAITLNPKNAEAHYNLGIIYGNQGMLEAAQQEMALGLHLKNERKF